MNSPTAMRRWRVKSDELEPLPVSLTNLNPQIIRARTVCSGSAGGILTPISSLDLNALGNLPAAKGVDAEQSALENGLTLVLKNIEFRLLDSDGATSAILEAHRSLAGDTSLREHLLAGVSAGLSCAEAIVASANHFCEEFSRSSSSYLQERAWTYATSASSYSSKSTVSNASRHRAN